jgi:hypothetical protein
MSIIRPKPGELVDRQTILELKLVHCDTGVMERQPEMRPKAMLKAVTRQVLEGDKTKHRNALAFMDEYELVQDYLIKYYIPDIATSDQIVSKYDSLYDQLSDINGKIWELEDEARILRDAPDRFAVQASKRAAEVLFSINDLNDKRSEIIHQIDLLWNIDHQEKMYAVKEIA